MPALSPCMHPAVPRLSQPRWEPCCSVQPPHMRLRKLCAFCHCQHREHSGDDQLLPGLQGWQQELLELGPLSQWALNRQCQRRGV